MNFKIKHKLEKYFISLLIKGEYFGKEEINTQTKTIYLGLYSIGYYLLDNKAKFIVALLVNHFKYKPMEERIEIKYN